MTLKIPIVLRWFILLEFSNLMLDIFLGFLTLYFHDVIVFSVAQAASVVFTWLVAGLLGDLLLIIVLLERMHGLFYLRLNVLLELVLFSALLLVPWAWLKLILVGFIGFLNSGWCVILKGRLYSALLGHSGTGMALNNVDGVISGILPFGIGLVADVLGLDRTIWFLLLGPTALFIGIPRQNIPTSKIS